MRLHRFFIPDQLQNKTDIVIFEEGVIHQLKNVFRLGSGDQLILLDNSGYEYLAGIVVLARGKAELNILEKTPVANIQTKELWLCASLIKKDNFEWILEKGTELGVAHFVPILSERSEKKDLNEERALKIIQEASEQSERGTLPRLHPITDLKDIFDFAKKNDVSLVAFHPTGELFDKAKASFSKRIGSTDMKINRGVLIGPEGGWSEREIEMFKEHSVSVYSLGHQILRAETMALAISSLLLL